MPFAIGFSRCGFRERSALRAAKLGGTNWYTREATAPKRYERGQKRVPERSDRDKVTSLVTTSPDWNSARVKSATITWVDSGELCGGHPLLYHLTRKERSADCPDCTAGVCVQRIESCAAWPRGQVLLVHGQQRTAN